METSSSPVVGIPRAMLYHRYAVLWQTFFQELGVETIVSGPTSRKVLEDGSDLAVDETCLSAKIFFGHVKGLVGRCDYILIPRINTFGHQRDMCVRFRSLYDQARNTFRESSQKFLAYDLDMEFGVDEETAFLELGKNLGFSKKEARKAYNAAKKEERRDWKERLKKQEQLLRADGLKVLLAGHSYLLEDSYVGRAVTDLMKELEVIPIRADGVDRERALKRSLELSPTCKWELNRELLGGIAEYRKDVDGIILISAFPCGPDAMVNEILTRKLTDIPLLDLVLDSQSGTAGIETRLESFVDIIRFKKGVL